MSILALLSFEGLNKFIDYSLFLDEIDWKIEKQLLKDRVLRFKDFEVFIKLKKMFYEKKLSIWELKDEEIITWFDTMKIVKNVTFNLLTKGINQERVHLVMEYPIVNGNHMRTDYLIVYDRLIIVIEFGMFNQDEKRSEERYTKKLQESINYRQIIANQVLNEIRVVNYTMIYRPEYDHLLKRNLDENIIYNRTEINQLTVFIHNLLRQQDSLQARNQLEKLA